MDNNSTDEKLLKAALLKRALGYEYEEKVIEGSKDGKGGKAKIIKKHVPPDVKAIERILYLINCGTW